MMLVQREQYFYSEECRVYREIYMLYFCIAMCSEEDAGGQVLHTYKKVNNVSSQLYK